MKKVFAVFAALVLALSLCLPAAAAGRGTTSGQYVPWLVDYDPQALSDIVNAMDISGLFNDLGFGDIGDLLGGFDLGGLLGDFDIGSLFDDFDLFGMFGDLGGCLCSCGGDDSTPPTTSPPPTDSDDGDGSGDGDDSPPTTVPKTGDKSGLSLAIAFGLFSAATVSVVLTRKKNKDEE